MIVEQLFRGWTAPEKVSIAFKLVQSMPIRSYSLESKDSCGTYKERSCGHEAGRSAIHDLRSKSDPVKVSGASAR